MLLAWAVPVNVNVLSFVMRSPTTPLSFENETMTGAAGAPALIVTLRALDAALTLPAVSVAVAVKLCDPSASVAVVKLQAPLPLAVTVPSSVAPS